MLARPPALLARTLTHGVLARSGALTRGAALARPHLAVMSARAFSASPRSHASGFGFRQSEDNLPWNTVIKFVPQQQSWVVERFGRFSRLLEPGLAVLLPFVDSISYVHTLKEVAVEIPAQGSITSDNVALELDGVLYYRIIDPYKASYGVEDPAFAVAQLAQTTMRAEIGKLTLDRTLSERAHLNAAIIAAIAEAAEAWGIECLRYEVRDIHLPQSVVAAMHSQVSAERSKRAAILESEGRRQAAINVAEGDKQAEVLASEAARIAAINAAEGNAQAVLLHAQATAKGIQQVASAIAEGDGNGNHGNDAASLQVAERWVDAWGGIAKNAGSVVVVPSALGDAAGMVAQGMSVFKSIAGASSSSSSAPSSSPAPSPIRSVGGGSSNSSSRPSDQELAQAFMASGASSSQLSRDVQELNQDIFEKTLRM